MLNSFLQQEAKLSWLKDGYENSKVFYQALKARRCQNRVNAIQNSDGVWVNQRAKVDDAFVNYYKHLFSCT